ncbi:hypothetical protein KQX54_006688 [Cotesia glomerata]|uniref:CUB domain-containing protein n=1 Tax=Cotesia glomerata TaxID=32391 RepID=A0AAV7J667_COTGL|nr:hypothetical protein KQX54_006688 [Cotesia glomerata]
MSHPNITGAFEAEYETVCNQFVELESEMVSNLESPNYPENYKPNKNCSWYFIAPENHRINIKFYFFVIESSQNCENDYVSIGVRNAWQVNSTERKVYVKFFTNESKQDKVKKNKVLAQVVRSNSTYSRHLIEFYWASKSSNLNVPSRVHIVAEGPVRHRRGRPFALRRLRKPKRHTFYLIPYFEKTSLTTTTTTTAITEKYTDT